MSKSIAQIKMQLLREAVQAKGLETTKPSLLSKIYPATGHGPNHPPRRVDLKSVPEVDHDADDEADADTKEVDTPHLPNFDRTTDAERLLNIRATTLAAILPRVAGIPVTRADQPVPPVKPQEEQHKTSPFVQRCVAAITGGQPSSKTELSGAFAKCVSTESKSEKPLSKSALARKGMAADKEKFVQAISKFKKQGHG